MRPDLSHFFFLLPKHIELFDYKNFRSYDWSGLKNFMDIEFDNENESLYLYIDNVKETIFSFIVRNKWMRGIWAPIEFFIIYQKIFKRTYKRYIAVSFLRFLYKFFMLSHTFFLEKNIDISFIHFRTFYGICFARKFHKYHQKFLGMHYGYVCKIIEHCYNFSKFTINRFYKLYFPIFEVLFIITFCFLLKVHNLFIILRFFRYLFLFDTTGIDFGHMGRRKQSCQTRELLNVMWHLLYRERCSHFAFKFLNFTNNVVNIMTIITHIQYTRKFFNAKFHILRLIINLRQSFTFMKGKKLAIRKRFVIRNKNKINVNQEQLERDFKLFRRK